MHPHRSFRAAAVLLWLAIAASCSRGPDLPPVILITFDTTRADHLSAYGYERKTTPRLDERLLPNAVRFDRMWAASNNTSCSFASLHSGVHVKSHGVIKLSPWGYPLDSKFTTLAEVLKDSGYFTVASVGATHLDKDVSGLAQGFDCYFDLEVQKKKLRRSCETVNAELLPALAAAYRGGEKRPLFLWLHYFDPHWPYDPPEPFLSAFPVSAPAEPPPSGNLPRGFLEPLRRNKRAIDMRPDVPAYTARYDGEILRTDHAAGEVLDALDGLGLLEKSIVVFTADHGENLGEHDIYYNHNGLYETVTHVPLVVHLPGMTGARASDALVHHVDVMPTILDAVGVPPSRWPQGLEGKSLVPILQGRGGSPHERLYTEGANHRGKSVRNDRYKLIIDGALPGPLLFDLEEDKGELRNLAASDPKTTARLLGEFDGFFDTRKLHLVHVAPTDASAELIVKGRLRATRGLAGVRAIDFDDEDHLHVGSANGGNGGGSGRGDVTFDYRLPAGKSKSLLVDAYFGSLFLDIASSAPPVDSETFWLAGRQLFVGPTTVPALVRRPTDSYPPILALFPDDRDVFPEKAPSAHRCLIRIEKIDGGSDSARYRFTLGSAAPGDGEKLTAWIESDGTFSDIACTSGNLRYEGFNNPHRAFVVLPKAEEEASFEMTVQPPESLLIMKGKIDQRILANTEFRIGKPGNDRAYPTTFFISSYIPEAEASEKDALAFRGKPGLHFWADPQGRQIGTALSPEELERLSQLGYINGGSAPPNALPTGPNAPPDEEDPKPPKKEDGR